MVDGARAALAAIVQDSESSPMRILGAAVSFLRGSGRSGFERALADKLDSLIMAETNQKASK